MQIDTIKKKDKDSKGVINLKSKEKKVFKVSSLALILKSKKDIIFYASLFLMMSVIIFFWGMNLKDNLKNLTQVSSQDKSKYEDIISSYKDLKNNIEGSIGPLKEKLKELNNPKKPATTTNNTTKTTVTTPATTDNDSQQKLILDSLTKDQINKLINQAPDQNIPQEFSQEELKARLDLLNK